MVSEFAALEGWLEPNTLEFTVKQWEAIGYFLAAGLMTADTGELKVLDIDVAADPQQVQERIGYMPQRFGLYEDLSVLENLNLYADMHGVTAAERRQRYPRLMEMTALGPFTDRLAGRLSGGMKQKLGLACTLVRLP